MLSLWRHLDQMPSPKRRLRCCDTVRFPPPSPPGHNIIAVTNMYLGIDIGGTFTDLVLMDEDGNISTAKAPTTPGELEKGVFDAIALVAATQGVAVEQLLAKVTAF